MNRISRPIPVFYNIYHILFRIDKKSDDECWNWMGDLRSGYGIYRLKTDQGLVRHQVHRVIWSIYYGQPNLNLFIDHICRNRKCLNPKHLREVTPQTNSLENSIALAYYNSIKTHCPQGHEYSEENTRRTKKGGRWCYICKMEKSKEFFERRKNERKP